MANLQVKNVPARLHQKLREQAKRHGRTIRDLVLEAVRREISREDFREQLARREPVELGRSAAQLVEESRSQRDRELGA